MENGGNIDQQIPSSSLNSPNPREGRRIYREQKRPFYRAILKSDWNAAQNVIGIYPTVLSAEISEGLETGLHIAALAKNVRFVKKLVEKMNSEHLELQNGQGNTPLCFSAADGNTKIAELMIEKNERLPTLSSPNGVKPIFMAASLGHRDMVNYLHPKSNVEDWSPQEQAKLLTTCIKSGLYDVAFKMVQKYTNLIAAKDSNDETALHVLARMPSAFVGGKKKVLWRRLISIFLCKKEAEDQNSQQFHAFKLLKFILEHVLREEDGEISNLHTEAPRLMFDAAEKGNTEFLIALIDYYPDLIWRVGDSNESIFHLAVSLRHRKIFNLLHEIGSIGCLLATYRDDDDNNMLHLAAKLAPPEKLNKVSGAALQMQRELLWYKEVEKIVQPSYRNMQNREGKTPQHIFSMEHKDLMKIGETWMKETATSCMLVATLIATVVFAAPFTVPGGIDSNHAGVPVLLKRPFFKVFTISEAIAMFSSSTSILMFLSILTSRYGERDFLHSLPLMLMIGIATLFVSIAAMVVSFCTTIFLSCHESTLAPILLGVFSCVPITFIILKSPLLVDIIRSTYVSRFLFRSDNRLFED